MNPVPPRIPRFLLCLFRDKTDHESLIGDYDEMFRIQYSNDGPIKAKMWYWLQVLKAIPSFIINSFYWRCVMIKNYLKITFRNLSKHKGFSIINIAGLALSMSICLMIIIFIRDQKSSDQFHEKKDRIAHVYTTDNQESWDVDGWSTTPAALAPYLLDNYPFIEDAVRLRMMWGNVLYSGTAIMIGGLYAEPSFFNIFSYSLKDGNPATALEKPYSIILSEKTAHKFFGNADPMNKTLNFEDLGDFTVTGVLRDSDQKSHFKFNALVSFATIPSLLNKKALYRNRDLNSWESFREYHTYNPLCKID